MSGEGSSKVMLNNKRLSAMIDSLQKEDIESELLRIGKPVSANKNDQFELPHEEPSDSRNSSPSKLFRSPAGLISLHSADKRSSMLSDYSGVVQEGIGISFVVQNQGKGTNESHPDLPALPSVETLGLNDNFSTEADSRMPTEDLVIKTVPNAKPVERLSSNYSKMSRVSEMTERDPNQNLEPNNSLRLLSINKHHLAPSSVGSGNLASESGSSSYNHLRNYEKQSPVLQPPVSQAEDSQETYSAKNLESSHISDDVSIVTSIIPPLSTTVREDQEGIKPVRSETTSYNPTVPPRSKNRPRSRLFIRDTLDDIETQLMAQMRDPSPDLKSASAVTRSSTNTYHSDAYFSATSHQNTGEDNSREHSEEPDEFNDDDIYLERPLPKVPSPVRRDSTIRAQEKQRGDTQPSPDKPTCDDDDDMYEDIDVTVNLDLDETEDKRPTTNKTQDGTKSKVKPSPKKKHGKRKKQELRSFDVDTLTQLLNVTKGTLIGSEFANLGMKIEEKRALERLVDSLSRLTADMVLDPDRYEEGLRRLDKATKALEGF
ncbi:hypothetical protein HG536_0G02500 [Torulaspora globosa]|uniref:Nba1p n=1 Tax=Torulaspora globosa TaxID=48254 RepID=A0A7G3ZLK3_9SACH|nr:uncharacterized protein HG536_0G02500 [Torulaspora globosa]QLL34389.1 hypothetical protein HG536_0G02500 [Torulaspora globosa]